MKKDEIVKKSNYRCLLALILCIILICGTFIGVVTKLVAPSTQADPDEGIRSFRYYTVLSNMISTFGAALCIPFEIDGLRNHNYHLPRWIVEVVYLGTNCVTVTFIIALFFLTPVNGIYQTLFYKASFYLHLICPVIAIILFILINDDHRIPLKESFVVVIPLLMYVGIYWIEVFLVGEKNGGWRDHYYTNVFFPYWVAALIVPFFGFAIANLLRVLHNKVHAKHKREIENYYLTSPDYDCENVEAAIVRLASREKPLDKGGEVIVPRRLITMLGKRYGSDVPLEELCRIYLDSYLSK